MKQRIATGILAASVVVGIGTGVAAHALSPDDTDEKPRATPSASATATTPTPEKTSTGPATQPAVPPAKPVLLPLGALQIRPGSVGPVGLGMSQSQALATGYVDRDVALPECAPAVDAVQWKPDYRAALNLGTFDDGQIASIKVMQPGPRTRSGLQVGSTYASVKAVLGADAVPEVSGTDRTGLFVSEGSNWLGFRFDGTPDTVTDQSPVTLIEIRLGAKPNLDSGIC